MHDYIIIDKTDKHWPGRLPFRGERTPRGRGYPSEEAADRRVRQINGHYNAKKGMSPGDLRVVERSW